MTTIYWHTVEPHYNNSETMNDFLENINMLEITLVDQTYAEGVNAFGKRYAINVSGNGDFNNHKVEFELIN